MIAIEEKLYQVDCKYKSSSTTPEYYEITFTDLKENIYVTYAVPGYENYNKWKPIIEHDDDAVVITNASIKTRYKKPKKNNYGEYIIDADSNFNYVEVNKEADQRKFLAEKLDIFND